MSKIKQFIKIFKTEDGTYESMVQRVHRQIKAVDKDAVVTIATAKTQVSAIHNQLGDSVGICVEPCRRDTFPAIALATAYLHDVQGVSEDETVVVCPVDPYVDDDYFYAVKELGELVAKDVANLVLMGMEPTYPSEKYGYIIPKDTEKVSKVDTFKEKPDTETAEKYISQGALWNGGVFAYKLKYVLNRAHELIDFLVEAMVDDTIGNAALSDTCENVHVINELDVPVLCMGLKDVVVAASPDGILVSDAEASSYIKPYVEQMGQQIMFADKSWGSYRVLDVSAGDVITMAAGCRHIIIAETELKIIEVQLGKDITVNDKHKFELE